MESRQPTSIGKYEILSVIGQGGMGIVYLALDPLMARQVAIKTVTEGFSQDVGMLRRFYGEAKKMGMLKHPNIITVYALGEHNGLPFIVMEFVEGDPLDRLIQTAQPIPLHAKLRIIEQVARALAYAHQNDVVHRDVKPANVIVRPDGVAKLLDFGIARQDKSDADHNLTMTGGVIGTVPYMAPERLRGADFDGRSDIFAVGVLLFQFLTGRLPFPGSDLVLINQLLNEEHPPLSSFLHEYPPALDGILDRSLAKDPFERYQTADEMASDLYSVIETLEQDYCVELMASAQRLSAEGNYVEAQNSVLQLLRIDKKNSQARAMAKEIDARITESVRLEQALRKQREAEDALRGRKFDDAIRLLEDAIGLVPDDPSILSQLNAARAKKQVSEKIFVFLQQAEAARSRGDYAAAQAVVEKAIELDTNNSRLRAAYQSLVRQAEEASLQLKLKQLLDLARVAQERKSYQSVLDFVQQAHLIEPENLELKEIERAARDGIFQEQRQRTLLEIEDQISTAITREDAERVQKNIQQALDNAPADAILLRYKAQIDRTVHEHRNRALVDDTVKQCSIAIDSAPLAALEKVRDVLISVPGDPRLISLEFRIKKRIEEMSTDEARAATLQQAREALTQRKFQRAVDVLAQCKAPILTPEISELLTYAREEAQEEERQQLIARSYAEGHALLQEHKYDDFIASFGPVALSTKDPRLQNMLAEAELAVVGRRARQADALALVKPFLESGCHEQAIAVIQSLPEEFATGKEMQAVGDALLNSWKEEHLVCEAVGRAYAALDSGKWEFASISGASVGDASPLAKMRTAFADHRRMTADKVLSDQIRQIQEAQASGAQTQAAAQLDKNRPLLPFASETVRAEWGVLAARYGKSNKMSRMGALIGRWIPKSARESG